MPTIRPSRFVLSALPRCAQRTLLVVALIATTTLLLSPLRGDPNTSSIALIFVVPVGLSTSLDGLTLGIVASLLAFLAFNFFFITPYYTLPLTWAGAQPPHLLPETEAA